MQSRDAEWSVGRLNVGQKLRFQKDPKNQQECDCFNICQYVLASGLNLAAFAV